MIFHVLSFNATEKWRKYIELLLMCKKRKRGKTMQINSVISGCIGILQKEQRKLLMSEKIIGTMKESVCHIMNVNVHYSKE